MLGQQALQQGADTARCPAARGCTPPAPCADIDGFSPHATVRVATHDRKRLERLCRYITRPALSDERVQCDAAGQLQLKSPWRDGTRHLALSPLESGPTVYRRMAKLRIVEPNRRD